MLNTYWALIFPSLTSLGGIFLMRQFMYGIPDQLLDAARIDGANEFRVVIDVIFPLALPVMSTYALMTLLRVWNDLMGPLFYVDNPPLLWTLQLVIMNLYSTGTFMYGSAYQDATGMRACLQD
jgi:ABC-type glycerol-3-phosphate transport system permease component